MANCPEHGWANAQAPCPACNSDVQQMLLTQLRDQGRRRFADAPDPAVVAQKIEHEFDIDDLLGRTMEILRREIKHLMTASADGKLVSNNAKDLVAYVKLLSDIKQEQDEFLRNLTDEQLEKMKDEK